MEGGLWFWKQPRMEVSLRLWRKQPRAGVWSLRPEGDPWLCKVWALHGYCPAGCLASSYLWQDGWEGGD